MTLNVGNFFLGRQNDISCDLRHDSDGLQGSANFQCSPNDQVLTPMVISFEVAKNQ